MLTIYMDNCGNSRANTCTKASTLAEEAHLLDQDQWGCGKTWLLYVVTHIGRVPNFTQIFPLRPQHLYIYSYATHRDEFN